MVTHIEFLETGSSECPLIRLYGTDQKAIALLHEEIARLAAETARRCPIHRLPGLRALSGLTLDLKASSGDAGIQRTEPSLNFEWQLTPGRWLDVADLIEPFVIAPVVGRYQWLSNKKSTGDIAFLLSYSADGSW